MDGELEIRFDWCELMEHGQSREKRQDFIKSIMEIGGSGGCWNGYTNTLIIEGFPQGKVPDVRDWLDTHGFIETDIQFTGVM